MTTDMLDAAPESVAAERPRREFLTFRLGEESYGVDILKVQEIRDIDGVTRVPHVPPYLRGVINLRGAIVPIVDLGLMLGFPEPLPLARANAIVLNAEGRLTGLVVTSVSDVIALSEDEIHPAPELGEHRAVTAAIAGIGVRDGASLMLLDVERLLARIREGRA
jgi:purine-binding chemotaxis protein CheW